MALTILITDSTISCRYVKQTTIDALIDSAIYGSIRGTTLKLHSTLAIFLAVAFEPPHRLHPSQLLRVTQKRPKTNNVFKV